MWLRCVAFAVGLLGAMALGAEAQPPGPPLEKLEEVKSSVQALSKYPKDVRAAILVVSQYPDLVKQMANTPRGRSPDLSDYSPEVVGAAHTLADTPEVSKILASNLPLTTLLGKAYEQDPELVKKIGDQIAEQEAKVQETSTDDWAERLKNDPEALKQLMAAAEAYLKEKEKSEEKSDSTDDGQTVGAVGASTGSDDGDSEDETGYAAGAYGGVVYDSPSSEVVDYALRNADQYSNLANQLVDQYSGSQNTEEFQNAVSNWSQSLGAPLNESFLSQAENRPQRLAEAASFQKQFTEALGGKEASPAAAMQFLQANKGEFPQLTQFLNPDALGGIAKGERGPFGGKGFPKGGSPFDKSPLGADSPFPKGGPFGGGNPLSKGGAGIGKGSPRGGPAAGGLPKGLGGRNGAPQNLTRMQPSPNMQLSRAMSSHMGAWNGPAGGMPRGGMGGPRMGGGRPGGGARPGGGPRPGPGR